MEIYGFGIFQRHAKITLKLKIIHKLCISLSRYMALVNINREKQADRILMFEYF